MYSGLIQSNIIAILMVLASNQAQRQNLIINGNFTEPAFATTFHFVPLGIPGWSCSDTCQIDNCEASRANNLLIGRVFPLCQGNVIDLDSIGTNQQIAQSLELKSGFYLLNFNYYYPSKKAAKKTLQVYFNDEIIFKMKPQIDAYVYPFYYQKKVNAQEGKNTIKFEHLGIFDGIGFKINNVSFYRAVDDTLQETVTGFFRFEYFKQTIAIPGGRVFFGGLLSFFVNLDRYEFYPYHSRLYSYNEQVLLSSIRELQSFKGSVLSAELRKMLPFVQTVEDFLLSLDFKAEYIRYASFDQQLRSDNFAKYFADFIVYSLPFILVVFLIFRLLFSACFHIRASKYLRVFAFSGVLLPLFFQGNIEEVTFYAFAELKSFFSLGFRHNLFNTLLLVVLFAVLFTCFGLYFFFRFHYGKKAKMLIEGRNALLSTVCSQQFDKGVLPFHCGVCHQMLLSMPTFQLIALFGLQVIVITKKVVFRSCYEKPALLWASILSGLVRLYFQITTFLYTFLGQGSRTTLNDDYHKVLAYLLVGCVSLEVIIILAYDAKGLIELVRENNTNQVQNSQEKFEQKTDKPIKSKKTRNTIKEVNVATCKKGEMQVPGTKIKMIHFRQRFVLKQSK